MNEIYQTIPLSSVYKRYLEKYWMGLTYVSNDDMLENMWEYITLLTLRHGAVCLFKDDGNKPNIGIVNNIFRDKNNDILGAEVFVQLWDKTTENKYIVNYKYWDIKDEISNKVMSGSKVYKGIFSTANSLAESHYLDWLPILLKICQLEKVGDTNREIMNVIYQIVNGKKYTREQLANFGLTLSKDGRGVALTNIDDDVNKDKPSVNSNFNSPKTITHEWIKEYEFWIEQLVNISGIRNESMKKERENVLETQDRTFRLNILENRFYKFRERFVKDYNLMFNKQAVLHYGTAICKEGFQSNDEREEIESE